MVEQSYKELPYRLEGEEAAALEAPAIRRGYVRMSMKITIFASFDDCLEDEKPSFLRGQRGLV